MESGDEMLENILKSVTEAEEKADKIILDAEQKAAQLVDDAKKQAVLLKAQTQNSIKLRGQELSKELQTQSIHQSDLDAQAADEKALELKASAASKRKEAVDAVMAMLI